MQEAVDRLELGKKPTAQVMVPDSADGSKALPLYEYLTKDPRMGASWGLTPAQVAAGLQRLGMRMSQVGT